MSPRWFMNGLAWSDLAIALWIVLCISLAVAIGDQAQDLDQYSTPIEQSADALEEIASALQLIARVPFIGDTVAEVAGDIVVTAAGMRDGASEMRSATARLSVLLAIAIAVIPTVPVLAVYLPYRVRDFRRSREIIRNLRHDTSAFARNYLANRALHDLTYSDLRRISHDPWTQVRRGEVDPLVAEELRRLGLGNEVPHYTMKDEAIH